MSQEWQITECDRALVGEVLAAQCGRAHPRHTDGVFLTIGQSNFLQQDDGLWQLGGLREAERDVGHQLARAGEPVVQQFAILAG